MRVSLLQPTSPKFNQFAEEVRKTAKQKYEYTFYEGEEVRTVHSLILITKNISYENKHLFT